MLYNETTTKLTLSELELDLIIRGLFVLQKSQPEESLAIQKLLNKFNSVIFKL